ncbi:MAG TPA: HAD-IIB family hydrolase [Bryobacteraceae bacterium]|nr:HAD-IIB family hydrolase [Bryobacteraceae bacterium]
MIVVFTDLDGTLLDHETYSWEPARPALDALARRRVPLILCTSKPRAEIEPLRSALGNRHPFIVENGGAAFLPQGYFPFAVPGAASRDGYEVIEFGNRYVELVEALRLAAHTAGVPVRGFSVMTAAEISERSGLSPEKSRLAKLREYDEPFYILDPSRERILLREIEVLGKRWTRGDRFFHITGSNDKATAVRRLMELYRQAHGTVTTIGLGDAPNDAEFLAVVDNPVLIRSRFSAALQALVPNGRLTARPGPYGWNEAILEMVPE